VTEASYNISKADTPFISNIERAGRYTPNDIYAADADTVPARVAALKARAEVPAEAETPSA
jgi:hypothetical protein